MPSLKAITLKAQATADREQRTVAILNLNPYSPLYVIRDYVDGMEGRPSFVAKVQPQGAEG